MDGFLSEDKGTVMLVINSVCGCAAASLRPAVRLALKRSTVPDHVATVFAGVDTEATERARSYLPGFPPSSASGVILKNGELVYLAERHMIEGHGPEEVARGLTKESERHCSK